jgi:2-aminoadipate transaminase
MQPISFARGIPSSECLPVEELADCARAALERDGAAALNYGAAGGYGPLREWLAARHGVEPARVVVTNGSLQAFLFLATCLVRRGPVVVEAPTYDRPLKLLAELGAEIFALPVDDEGLDVGALELLLRQGVRPAFLYTIPTFQNPSGRTLSKARRRRLVRLARGHDLLIVEDDPYGLVRFEGKAPPTLFDLDGGANVVYSSSFSKTVAPGLRVGYLVLPAGLAVQLEAAATSTYITPALVAQATAFEYLRRERLAANLARTCELLRTRRDVMLAALGRELPHGRWSRPEGGYFLWLELPEGAPAAELARRAATAGVTFVPGSDFFPPGAECVPSLRLAFSHATPPEIDEGIARLASAVGADGLRRAA